MKRIGMWVSMGLGGADKSSYYLAKGFKELGYEVVIFYGKKSIPDMCSQWDSDHKILSRFDSYKDFEIHYIEDAMQLRLHNLDVLSTQRSGEDLWLIPNLERNGYDFPVIETNFHGGLLTKADHRIFPSQALVDFKNITEPYSVIPNPIMPVYRGNLREELGIPKDAFVFGKISRPSNDIFTPIPYEAYKLTQSDNTYFIQMGMNSATEEIVNRLSLKNFISVEQTLDEKRISQFYNTFDVYCHSNKIGETFGNTIAESMSHGKPVVSHTGIKNWPQAQLELLSEFSRFVVQSEGQQAITEYAQLMQELMNNPEIRLTYANYCLKKSTQYNYLNVASKHIELYKHIIKTNHNGEDFTLVWSFRNRFDVFKESLLTADKYFPKEVSFQLIDAASNDDTIRQVRELANSIPDRTIRICESPYRSSLSEAWNLGIMLSNTRYVIFASSDCVFLSSKLFAIINFTMRQHEYLLIENHAVFALDKRAIPKLGWFDEEFVLGPHFDCDYMIRASENNVRFGIALNTGYYIHGDTAEEIITRTSEEVPDRLPMNDYTNDTIFKQKWQSSWPGWEDYKFESAKPHPPTHIRDAKRLKPEIDYHPAYTKKYV